MNRVTVLLDGTYYVNAGIEQNENGFSGQTVERLAKFENIYDDLRSRQQEISNKLDVLRADGKSNSVKFKELLGEKLLNNNMLIVFQKAGLYSFTE